MSTENTGYPDPLTGQDGNEPGFWAQAAVDNPWRRGTRSSTQQGTRHNLLRAMLLRREPALRVSTDGTDFHSTLGRKNANIEALLAQSV
ncbi:hypothetical protein NUU61_003569 [Penicillium alfredii]|uniref:Uncharacterized protein n=1 Tax=Penicillium alfredii TaxID=1506179 RepID=A0A9W9FK11_9EURO|nr:uncharacterized protein NUU61_003569 [Penicillium alfredii]KAJ5101347.1 hypothetical protein NUU61_003569 [Penicillium alfredii]